MALQGDKLYNVPRCLFFLDVFAFLREMQCWTCLYKSPYTGTIDLPL